MSADYAKIIAEYTELQEEGAVLRCFRDIAPKQLCWLWPGRIPLGKLTLFIGDPGLGKSLLTADIASRVTCGTSFSDGATCESGNVIFLSAEDDPGDTIRPRLDAAGADVSRIHILEAVRVKLTRYGEPKTRSPWSPARALIRVAGNGDSKMLIPKMLTP